MRRVRRIAALLGLLVVTSSCATSFADDPAVPENQYTLTLARSWSRSTACSGTSAAGLTHSWNFSTIQASWPTGESVSAYASVCGRVDWSCR